MKTKNVRLNRLLSTTINFSKSRREICVCDRDSSKTFFKYCKILDLTICDENRCASSTEKLWQVNAKLLGPRREIKKGSERVKVFKWVLKKSELVRPGPKKTQTSPKMACKRFEMVYIKVGKWSLKIQKRGRKHPIKHQWGNLLDVGRWRSQNQK